MARAAPAGRGSRGEKGGRGGHGRGAHGKSVTATIPRKTTEVGACKDLEGHIFTIGSGNKGKDGDMLRTSMEKMATYIGTKYGDEAAQEWISGKRIVLQEPTYSQAIRDRHEAQVKATKDRIELKLRNLKAEKTAIQLELDEDPNNRSLLKEMREAEDQIAQSEIELVNEVAMKLTDDGRLPMLIHGGPTERQLRASRLAGGRFTPCCWVSALKFLWAR